jgi:hypothetical protein
MSAAPHPTADGMTRLRRRLRLAAALACLQAHAALVPRTSTRRRQRLQICAAARVLTALGVRVRVIGPRTPWPRHRPCRLVAADDVGWLGDLALVTSVPRTAAGWRAACGRALLRGGRSSAPDLGRPDAVACPVAVRYRTEAGPLDRAPRTLAEIVAVRGLVVEVHLLPALDHAADAVRPDLAPAA